MKNLRVAAIIFLILSATVSFGRVIDADIAYDDILRKISSDLDAVKVDVRNGMGGTSSTLDRPQVANLRNFPAQKAIAGIISPFDANFEAGVASDRAYLVAVDAPGEDLHPSEQKFRQIWQRAARDERVFVSFSSKDIKVAEQVATSLNKIGFITFTYMNGTTSSPLVNAVETGQYFSQAGRHYVIDTTNARQSPAVNAEALALRKNNNGMPPIFGRGERDVPCCKRCTEQYGIRTCGPVFCGEIACAGAR